MQSLWEIIADFPRWFQNFVDYTIKLFQNYDCIMWNTCISIIVLCNGKNILNIYMINGEAKDFLIGLFNNFKSFYINHQT